MCGGEGAEIRTESRGNFSRSRVSVDASFGPFSLYQNLCMSQTAPTGRINGALTRVEPHESERSRALSARKSYLNLGVWFVCRCVVEIIIEHLFARWYYGRSIIS